MINVTKAGHKAFTDAITSTLRRVHLHTDGGELTGHGYVAQDLIPSKWDEGVYPDVLWTFQAGDPIDVVGYYVTLADGSIALSESFTSVDSQGNKVDAPMNIKNTGDKIVVSLRYNLLSSVR